MSSIELEINWMVYAAVFARCLGCTCMLPFGETLNTLPRLLFSVGLSVAIYPLAALPMTFELGIFHLIVEFVLGVLISTPLRIFIEAAEMFGELIDTARGQTIGSVQDPLNGQMVSDLASVSRIVTLVLVVQLGGLEALCIALSRSYDAAPIGWILALNDGHLVTKLLSTLFATVGGALKVATIWFFAFVITDLGCALAGRLASGFSFSTFGQLVKVTITFGMLMVLMSEFAAAPAGWMRELIVGW